MAGNGHHRHRPIILKLPSESMEFEQKEPYHAHASCSLNRNCDEPTTASGDQLSHDVSTDDSDQLIYSPDFSGQSESSTSSDNEEEFGHNPLLIAPQHRKFLESWKIANSFLEYDKKKNVMFCKICRQFAGPTQQKMHFVAGTNNFRFSAVIFHKTSSLHLRCKKIAEESRKDDPLQKLDIGQRKLVQVLKLVYFMVKTKIPFTDFPKLCKRRKEYGLDIGPAYTSHKMVVPLFAKYIAQHLETGLSQKLDECGLFTLIIDSSLTRVAESHQLVYMRYFKEDELKTHFLGVIDSKGSPHCVYQNLDNLFKKIGKANWINKIAHVFIDVWSSCPSWYDTFIETLNENSEKNVISGINILPHKISRSNRLFNCNVLSQHFRWLIFDIFWFYNKVPETLPHIEKELNALTAKNGNLHKKISASFSIDTFEAINNDWAALVLLLRNHTQSDLDARSRNNALRILVNITRSKFLCKLALVLDIFKCLNVFASMIEDPDFMPASLPIELKKMSLKIEEQVMNGRGEYIQRFKQEYCPSSSRFRDIEICENASFHDVQEQIQNPVNALLDHINNTADTLSWLENTTILDTGLWPKDDSLASFGNAEFSDLYLKLFKDGDPNTALAEWCTLKNNVHLCFPHDVMDTPRVAIANIINVFQSELPMVTGLLEKLLLLNFSSAELEKGYCESGLLKSSERSRLSATSLHNSMMISVHGPPLEKFDPLPVMEAWLGGCTRRYHTRKDGEVPLNNSSLQILQLVSYAKALPD